MCFALALAVRAAEPDAHTLYKEAREAERKGDVVRAYLLYSEAAAGDPKHAGDYWRHALALRTQAALKARPLPKISASSDAGAAPPESPSLPQKITEDDLDDVRRLRPPPELKAKPGRQTLDLHGDAKSLFEQVGRAFGLGTAFDSDYQGGPARHVRIEDADYRDALHTLEAATDSFAVPLSARLFLVAKDTPAKRAELEPTVAVTVPIPDPVTVQAAQEMARAIQQTMDIAKFAVDGNRHMVLIRDRISKVRPAQRLFEQLAHARGQVVIDLQFLEVDESTFYSYGFLMPNQFPILYLGRDAMAGSFQALSRLFFGHTLLGLGIANANLFANMTESTSKLLLDAQVRSVDGEAASFHVGDKYPIATAGFFGQQLGFPIPPTFNFEDLGLTLKITPHVHGMEEVSLDINAEFKVLGSQSFNGVPTISNRKLESKVRLRTGDWAVVAGLMTTSEARSISGIAGLSSIPLLGELFRKHDDTNDTTRILLLLKPRIVSAPPTEYLTRAVYVGSEARLQIPL